MKCFQLSPGVIRDSLMPVHHVASRTWIGGKTFLALREK